MTFKELDILDMESSKLRVLLIEDHKISQKIGLLVLKGLGCDADCAGNGAEALEFCARNKYHIIFMDIGLPDYDGLAVTQQIRQLEANRPDKTPIIALTAHTHISYEAKALEVGMDYFLEKPLLKETAAVILNHFVPERYSKLINYRSRSKQHLETLLKTVNSN